MKKLVATALAASLAACAPPMPLASPGEDSAGRQFTAPTNGQSALYIYGRSAKIGLSAGRLMLGDVMDNHWLRTELPPGQYDLRCVGVSLELSSDNLLLDLAPGQVSYVSVGMDLWRGACAMRIEPAAVAQPAILAGKRVRELR